MKSRKVMLAFVMAALMAGTAGCGQKDTADAASAPEATEAPTATPTPATATPTPAPVIKAVGEKTEGSRFVELTNSTGKEIKELYFRVHGEAEWGENRMGAETVIKADEIIQLNYIPSSEEEATYDVKWNDSEGNTYEMSYLKLADMSKASLLLEDGTAFLKYQSLTEKKEINSKDVASQMQAAEEQAAQEAAAAEAQAAQEAAAAEEPTYYEDSSGGDDTGYYDDSYYDDSSSGGEDYTDYGSYDDNSYDSGSSGGESYDDGSGDGAGTDAGCADTGGDIVIDENGNWSVQ